LEIIEEEGLVENARKLGQRAMQRMLAMKERYPLIGDVRGVGLLLGIELVKDRQTKEKATDEAEAVMYRALELGLSFKLTMGSILTLSPPLIITEEELDRALDIIEQCIRELG
jgi:4-aminobutyrate aminotransferase